MPDSPYHRPEPSHGDDPYLTSPGQQPEHGYSSASGYEAQTGYPVRLSREEQPTGQGFDDPASVGHRGQHGYPPPGAEFYPGYSPAAKTNGTAIAALATGIVGWTVVPFFASIAAVVLGHVARAQIRRTGEQGSGLALAGLILGYTGTVVIGAFTVLAFAAFMAVVRSTVS